jgi:hypothetical protein
MKGRKGIGWLSAEVWEERGIRKERRRGTRPLLLGQEDVKYIIQTVQKLENKESNF